MKQTPFFNQLYFSNRFYLGGLISILVFIFSWLFHWPLLPAQIWLLVFLAMVMADFAFLFLLGYRITCTRHCAQRFSNSDYNNVQLTLWHSYPFTLRAELIEEFPEQFQARSNQYKVHIPQRTRFPVAYKIRPVQRGDYQFGHTICLIGSQLGLVNRRLLGSRPTNVKVYPSFFQLRQFHLVAQGAIIEEAGNTRLRRIGHSLEFETIKEYVPGDDIRVVNWKATARKGGLMVNQYTEEKSQQVYCIIDQGRLMKMPFADLALVDYAINSTLVMASVALHRQDRFGLLSFSHKQGSFVAADRKPGQLKLVQESLYRMSTSFFESDFEKLYLSVRKVVKQRSLLILFTNFESVTGMRRQLPYLRQLSRHHLLLVVFFQNTELADLSEAPATNLEQVYTSTVAGKFVYEKKLIVKELKQHGILSLLASPEELTVQTVNKYIELKTKQAL